MKLLVLGGTHGNELLGIELVKILQANPIPGIDAVIANPRAVEKGVRFIETDLNRSFGEGESYEYRRAQELKETTKNYDIVFDFHNTQTLSNDCGFVGTNCRPELYAALQLFGIANCIEATYDCINKYCKNVVSIEVSIGSELDAAEYWYGRIRELCKMKPRNPQSDLTIYRYLRRVGWDEIKDLDTNEWKPFRPLAKNDKLTLEVPSEKDVVPIFIGSRLTPFYATLLTKERMVQ